MSRIPQPQPVLWRDALTRYLREQAQPPEKYGHQPRLYAWTRLCGAGQIYDDDIVFAAAFLHDLGVFLGHRPEAPSELTGWDHVGYALRQVPAVLTGIGFPVEKLPGVLHAIKTHQPKDEPTSMEAVILRDADILEQLGAIGVLRAAAKVGRDSRYLTFTPVAAFLRRNLDTLPGAIRLTTTRALAEPKIALLRAFLDGLDAEDQGKNRRENPHENKRRAARHQEHASGREQLAGQALV